MTTIYYTKRFVSGALKGLSVDMQVSFATREAADSFAVSMRPSFPEKVRKDICTSSRFVVTDLAYQKYSRA